MPLTIGLIVLILAPPTIPPAPTAIPAPAVRYAQSWLDSNRATDPELKDARLGHAYPAIGLGAKRGLEFLRSDIVDPTVIADTVWTELHFPIVKADTLFSSLTVLRRDEPHRYWHLEPVEHAAMPLDIAMDALSTSIAMRANRVWLVGFPWASLCRVIVAEKPNGDRLVFEVDGLPHTRVEKQQLLSLAEPTAVWSQRTKERIRAYYAIDEKRVEVASHRIPMDATREAERAMDGKVTDERRQLFGVTGPARLGEAMIDFVLDPIEQLLYAESDALDPTIFDRNPDFIFRVLVEDQVIVGVGVRRAPSSCDRGVSEARYMSGGYSLLTPDTADIWPSPLKSLGSVARVRVLGIDTWYHVVNGNSSWMAAYYPRDAANKAEPVSALAHDLKERIRAKWAQ